MRILANPGVASTATMSALLAALIAGAGCRGAEVQVGSPHAEAPLGAPAGAPISFEYDVHAPLDVREARREDRPRATLVDLTYASPRGGRVPAYVVNPRGATGPFAAVLFVHWGQGERAQFLPDALRLAEMGAISVLIDAPFARAAALKSPAVQDLRDEYLQGVVDLRRALDLMLGRADVDPKRIGFVGHSYGGHMAGIIAGIDPRVRAFVVMGGVASLTELMRTGDSPDLVMLREKTPKPEFEAYLARMAPLDARHFVTRASANTSFLFQYAKNDRIVSPPHGPEYLGLAPGKKELKWYDGGHELSDPRATIDRLAWLAQELSIASPSAAWREMAGDIP